MPSSRKCLRHRRKSSFYIWDVRDLASVKNAMHGVDYIFHAAALKQVPSCEFFPLEAVETNVLTMDMACQIKYMGANQTWLCGKSH